MDCLNSLLFRFLAVLGLFLIGSLAIIVLGGIAGLAFSIRPDQAGGFIYLLLGALLNILLGLALAAMVVRGSPSPAIPRIVFYSFTAPAMCVGVLVAYLLIASAHR